MDEGESIDVPGKDMGDVGAVSMSVLEMLAGGTAMPEASFGGKGKGSATPWAAKDGMRACPLKGEDAGDDRSSWSETSGRSPCAM
jgi:hypothetical protein